MEGSFSHDVRGATTGYLPNSNTQADAGGGTYTGANRQPSIEDYEAIFGPSARDIKQDNGRFKRHQRWHLPDVLKGPNEYLTDRFTSCHGVSCIRHAAPQNLANLSSAGRVWTQLTCLFFAGLTGS